jgi:hypothetical protein
MQRYYKRRQQHNPYQLDLFLDRRERELRTASPIVRHLSRKHHLSVEHAIAIAIANGLGCG